MAGGTHQQNVGRNPKNRGGYARPRKPLCRAMDGVKTALTAADKAYTEADKALRDNQGIIKAAVHLEELGVSHKKP